jgi:SSS family transporter
MLLTVPIAWYASTKVKNSSDFVLAGRHLGPFMATATVFATWFGSESILGAGSKMAEGGFSFVIEDPFGAGLCLILAGLFFNRKLYRLNHLTIGDYFAERYNRPIATLLSLIMVITYFGWVGAQFVAMGIILHTLLGISLSTAIVGSATIVALYTLIGGMWSVSLTDSIQTVIITIGLGFILWEINTAIDGGIATVLTETPADFYRVFPPAGSGSSDWMLFITALMTLGLGSIPQQDIYQRAMAARSETISVYASVIGGCLYFTIVLIPLLLGLCARHAFPDLLHVDSQLLIPTLIQTKTSQFTQIVFFGALLSAIMSTASGALLAPATLLAENIITPITPSMNEKSKLMLIRLSVLFIAVIAILLGISQGKIYEMVGTAYTITLVSAFIPLAFGLYSKRACNFGAYLAIVLGAGTWLGIEHFYPSCTVPAPLAGFLCSFAGMLIGSSIKAHRPDEPTENAQI